MSKKKKFTIEPAVLGLQGQPIRELTLVTGNSGPLNGGIGATGATGSFNGDPLLLTAPNGSVWEIIVDNSGALGTVQISAPVNLPSNGEGIISDDIIIDDGGGGNDQDIETIPPPPTQDPPVFGGGAGGTGGGPGGGLIDDGSGDDGIPGNEELTIIPT